MMRVGLRLRFGVAAVLLVCTTVIASVWTLAALSRLSGLVTDTVRDSEAVTAVTSTLSGALEREDDAVLLVLAGDQRGTSVLARERTVVDKAVADSLTSSGRPTNRNSPSRSSRSCRRIGERQMRWRRSRQNAKRSCSITNGPIRCCVARSRSRPSFAIDISSWRGEP